MQLGWAVPTKVSQPACLGGSSRACSCPQGSMHHPDSAALAPLQRSTRLALVLAAVQGEWQAKQGRSWTVAGQRQQGAEHRGIKGAASFTQQNQAQAPGQPHLPPGQPHTPTAQPPPPQQQQQHQHQLGGRGCSARAPYGLPRMMPAPRQGPPRSPHPLPLPKLQWGWGAS